MDILTCMGKRICDKNPTPRSDKSSWIAAFNSALPFATSCENCCRLQKYWSRGDRWTFLHLEVPFASLWSLLSVGNAAHRSWADGYEAHVHEGDKFGHQLPLPAWRSYFEHIYRATILFRAWRSIETLHTTLRGAFYNIPILGTQHISWSRFSFERSQDCSSYDLILALIIANHGCYRATILRGTSQFTSLASPAWAHDQPYQPLWSGDRILH